MFIRSKIQFFESKSQPHLFFFRIETSCLSDQRYNFLKANHNTALAFGIMYGVVYQIKDTIFWKQITTKIIPTVQTIKLFIRSKIQFFESKSQLTGIDNGWTKCCLSDQRYNFLKANHNRKCCDLFKMIVVYQIKDTIFWKQITT